MLSVRQVVFFLLYFNEHSIQLFMCLSPRSFTSRIWSQDLVVGWQIWNFFLIGGLCLCSPIFCGERGFFRGGGGGGDERGM